MHRLVGIAATKLQEWIQGYFEVLKSPCLCENFHPNIAGSEVRNVQIYYPPRILLPSAGRIDERVVLHCKIDSELGGLLNGLNYSHSPKPMPTLCRRR